MRPLFKSKFRIASLISLALLAQCCCCFLPVSWQVREQQQRQMIQSIERTLQANLQSVGVFLMK